MKVVGLPSCDAGSWSRCEVVFRGPGVVCCPICALPSLQLSSTKRPGKLSLWCGSCSMRAPSILARWAAWWMGRGLELREEGVDAARKYLAFVEGVGAGLPWNHARWEPVVTSTGDSLRCPVALHCLSCGAPGAARGRTDKHGRPYVTCGSCRSRVFTYRYGAMARWLGIHAELSTAAGLTQWAQHYEAGEARLRELLSPPAPAPAEVEDQSVAGVHSVVDRSI